MPLNKAVCCDFKTGSLFHNISMHFQQQFVQIDLITDSTQPRNDRSHCWIHIVQPSWPWWLQWGFFQLVSLSWLCCLFVFLRILLCSLFTSNVVSVCECVSYYIPALCPTSSPPVSVGSSEHLSVSPRVRDQSEAPISPTTTTVDAAGHREGSGLTSCHTDPASQGQNPGPWATVSHCVSFQPSRSHGGYWRDREGLREGGRPLREKKSTQRPRDLFVACEQWSMRRKAFLLLAGCLVFAPLSSQVVAAEPANKYNWGNDTEKRSNKPLLLTCHNARSSHEGFNSSF